MAESTRSLRSPLTLTIDESRVKLLTIGYVAAALGRTTWTIRHYEAMRLMPPAAFVLNKKTLNTRRRLYVDELDHGCHEWCDHERANASRRTLDTRSGVALP